MGFKILLKGFRNKAPYGNCCPYSALLMEIVVLECMEQLSGATKGETLILIVNNYITCPNLSESNSLKWYIEIGAIILEFYKNISSFEDFFMKYWKIFNEK